MEAPWHLALALRQDARRPAGAPHQLGRAHQQGARAGPGGGKLTQVGGVLFLVADAADFVTGSTMSINGGQHIY